MRHTATNTKLLAHWRGIFNWKIYKTALAIYNAQGKLEAINHMAKYMSEETREARIAKWSAM